MVILRNLDRLPQLNSPVVALGNFDGVHLGHRAILKRARERALAYGGQAFALTFEPLPAKLLFPERAPSLLTAPEDKFGLLRQAEIDGVIVIEFTPALSAVSARDFVRRYLVEKIGAKAVVVGHSVSFGHHRAGNSVLMEALGRELGFETVVVGPIKIAGTDVSSTRIRTLIAQADLKAAASLLGRFHFISGLVVHGRERGRKIGFPTANLACETECVPPDGVYATRAVLPGGPRPAITNIGMRPTFGEPERTIETHIFDFDRDLYGSRLKVEMIELIRTERKFDSPAALSRQIGRDLEQAKEILAAVRT